MVGVGNPWRCDDAAGLAVARRLGRSPPEGVRILEWEGEPIGLLEEWSEVEEAIAIDAVSSGAAAGTVHRIEAAEEALPLELRRGSTHAMGLADAIELGRELNRLPRRLLLLGIEGSRFEAGAELSEEVDRAVERVELLVRDLVGRQRP